MNTLRQDDSRVRSNTSTTSGLTISYLNANFLSNKVEIIEKFLADERIDVLILAEAHIHDEFNIDIKDYQIFRFDTPDAYSGMALFVLDGVDFSVVDASSTERHDCITFRVGGLQLSAFYVSPSSLASVGSLPYVTDSHILVGDFNAKHTTFGCKTSNDSGRALKRFTQDNSLLLINSSAHTFFHRSHDYSEILDLVFVKKSILDLAYSYYVGPDVNSDHLPIIFKLDLRAKRQTLIRHKRLDYSKADWQTYMHTLEQQSDYFSPSTPAEIEWEADEITQTIRQAANTSIPQKQHIGKQLPRHIIADIRIKRRLRRQLQRTDNIQVRQQINAEINRLHKNITRQIKEFDNLRINNYLQNIPQENEQIGTFYKKIKTHTKQHKTNTTLKDSNGQLITSHKSIANTFATNLQQKMTEQNHNNNTAFQSRVNSKYNSLGDKLKPLNTIADYQGDDSELTTEISSYDIMSTIETIKTNSATGPDQISYTLLMFLPLLFIDRVASLFTAILQLGYFPSFWKYGHVIMLLKPGKPKTDPNSYRPITLTSCLCKIFERIINSRLTKYLDRHGLNNEFQGAFRRGRGTHDQIHRVYNSARENSRQGKATAAVFLDIARAFDSVWHKGLKVKLARLPSPVCRLLCNYLDDRHLQVRHEDNLSHSFCPEAGVPQGGVLSPTLYSYFTSDYPTFEHNRINLAVYADDTALWTSHLIPEVAVHNLQTSLDSFLSYCNRWKICLNPGKTQATVFAWLKHSRQPINRIRIYDQTIPWSNHVTYLGVVLSNNFSFNPHYDYSLNKAKRKMAILRPILRLSTLNINSKLSLLKTLVFSILLYAAQAISPSQKLHTFNKYDKFQTRCLRFILNLPRQTPDYVIKHLIKIPTITDMMTRIMTRYKNKLHGDHPALRYF